MSSKRPILTFVLTAAFGLLAFSTAQAGAAGTGSISGIVTGGATEGVPAGGFTGPCVAAYDSTGTRVGEVRSGSGGNYTLSDLDTGDYRLEIIDCAVRIGQVPGYSCVGAAVSHCILPGLRSEFYDNARTLAAATPVSVTDGVETTGINATLATDGGISGTVTDGSGNPLEGVCVKASDVVPSGVDGVTDSSGQYLVSNLGARSYDLEFSDCANPEDPSVITASLGSVNVDESAITTGADIQLATTALPPPPPPDLYAAIGDVSVKGPAKVKKGKRVTYRIEVTNSGDADATGVEVKAKGRGVNSSATVGEIAPGATKTVKLKLKPKKRGKAKLHFKVSSDNAGSDSVKRRLVVGK